VQLPLWTGFHCLAPAFHSHHPIHPLHLTRPAFDSTPRPHLNYQHTICQFIACSSYVKQASSYPDLSYLLISFQHRQIRLHLFSVYPNSLESFSSSRLLGTGHHLHNRSKFLRLPCLLTNVFYHSLETAVQTWLALPPGIPFSTR
jgi:hypothetical protein